jgi:hypothetical protein
MGFFFLIDQLALKSKKKEANFLHYENESLQTDLQDFIFIVLAF